MSSLILYGHHESGHTYKVALALALGGIEYEYRRIDILAARQTRPAEFLAVSRFGEVPVLVDGVQTLTQSNAILLHLARKHRCLGAETEERHALSREWLFWEANRIGISLANLRHLIRFEKDASPAVIDWLRRRFELDAERLDAELSAKPFRLGEAVSIADISCSAYFFFAHQIGTGLAAWPAVQGWLERIRSQPGWQSPQRQ